MSDAEQWRPVPDWPEYQVSDHGRIKRVAAKRDPRDRAVVGGIRKTSLTPAGYPIINLTRPGKRQAKLVHRLVAFAFLGPPLAGQEVNHRDSDRGNPRLDNLEWVTRSQNIKHGYDHGHCDARGASNGHSKLTDAAVRVIRSRGLAGQRESAAEFDVTSATVRDVIAGRTWKHVD